MARIRGVQTALALHPSKANVRLDRSLREELNSTLKLEEKFWALKSRVGWVVDRDKNTNIFHTSTIIRRRFNKIFVLRTVWGIGWRIVTLLEIIVSLGSLIYSPPPIPHLSLVLPRFLLLLEFWRKRV